MEDADKTLDQIKEILIRELSPKKVYLFGSRGRGDHAENSDYDMVVIVEKSKMTRFDREIHARRLLRGLGAAIDIFVYTQAEFDEWKNELSSIPEVALREGRELDLG